MLESKPHLVCLSWRIESAHGLKTDLKMWGIHRRKGKKYLWYHSKMTSILNLDSLSLFLFFHRTTFSEFAQKHGKEARFKAIEKMREREGLYNEYMLHVRRQAKEEGISKAEKVGSSSAFFRDGVGWRWGVGALVRPLVCILEILTHCRIWNLLQMISKLP